ncbi:hypothetical protein [Lactiplantibacillus pentosus]|uniref:hypothetical protein n=2 Tax=Lactiplantibacillus pentosus TaxID=1589 RepID=UPI001CDB9D66|nr:hypothetical protein [Lactiplantibacillus pentosus]MDT6967349.1 hypothetical protein [Lactiplantibacillus pentosus]MDT7000917.1 hypothetical protein [Lactiplantibacillus pentosus]
MMIGHITAMRPDYDVGILTDFHGRHFKFRLTAVQPASALHIGAEFFFDPRLTAAGLVAVQLRYQHHDGTCLSVRPPTEVDQPVVVRIGELVLNVDDIQYYALTTDQAEIRNGYASSARHLVIKMRGGRQFIFYNWDGVNIDDVVTKLATLHTVQRQFG